MTVGNGEQNLKIESKDLPSGRTLNNNKNKYNYNTVHM